MKSRFVNVWLMVLPALAGCASMDCCNWFGRNTDGSSNLGYKPTPVQAGPIAGTYVRPAAGTVSPTVTENGSKTPPVIISSPAEQAPSAPAGVTPGSSLLTPPPPAPPTAPGTSGSFPGSSSMNGLPPAELVKMHDGAMPAPPAISAPAVSTPSIDLQVPGATPSASPMLLVPVTAQSPGAGASLQTSPPVIEMPNMTPPQIQPPVIPSTPRMSGTGVSSAQNPGTVPPPLPPPPPIPALGGK